MYFTDIVIHAPHNLCTMRPPGLGKFPVTSLSVPHMAGLKSLQFRKQRSLFKDKIFLCGTFKLLAE